MSTLEIKRCDGKIFCPLTGSWHVEIPEEKVRQEYIKNLVENYGYAIEQMEQEMQVNNSQRGQGKARADIVVWKSAQDKLEGKNAFIIVECKAENIRIREEDYYQGSNYAAWAGASFFVTTNEKETKYFKEGFKDDQLFDENEVIKIRQNSFEQILEKLETYNLSDTQDDVKGIAFEHFLGTTFRGELGQYFTPRTIVDFMTHILDPNENEIICDPTCGSGGFLIKAFEYVREKIEEDIKTAKTELRFILEGENYNALSEKEQIAVNEQIEAMQSVLNKELDTQVEGSRMYNLSRNCLFGTDANPRMARTSKMNMIMHGDGHSGVHHHDGLLNVNGIFEERFDVILTNPPFGSRIDKSQKITEADRIVDAVLIARNKEKYGERYEESLKQVNENIGKPLLSLYDVGSMSGLTEVLFMERCLKLLKKGGRMGMVLPEGILNTSNLQKIREYFEGKARIILICSIPQDVFIAAGATVKPSLVFFKRFTETEEQQYREAKTAAEGVIRLKYAGEIEKLRKIIEGDSRKTKGRARVSAAEKELAELEKTIVEEAKPLTKQYFDYEIPVAMVRDAGITSTGAVSEGNQLPALQEAYKTYRVKNRLWNKPNTSASYTINSAGKLCHVWDGEEVELKC